MFEAHLQAFQADAPTRMAAFIKRGTVRMEGALQKMREQVRTMEQTYPEEVPSKETTAVSLL